MLVDVQHVHTNLSLSLCTNCNTSVSYSLLFVSRNCVYVYIFTSSSDKFMKHNFTSVPPIYIPIFYDISIKQIYIPIFYDLSIKKENGKRKENPDLKDIRIF